MLHFFAIGRPRHNDPRKCRYGRPTRAPPSRSHNSRKSKDQRRQWPRWAPSDRFDVLRSQGTNPTGRSPDKGTTHKKIVQPISSRGFPSSISSFSSPSSPPCGPKVGSSNRRSFVQVHVQKYSSSKLYPSSTHRWAVIIQVKRFVEENEKINERESGIKQKILSFYDCPKKNLNIKRNQ